ncbi:putative Golgi/cell cycle associated protein [Giardia muris]|uniref:Putative Golgi/cell cycle associated protein n=1 Tax=Giardia muris TaxID=5742 RepID=A0A4Z1SU25_GIAMU|nr:putative Golgi/cell cycle associated protein [Giardia muris]|eukprot:TNJ29386.1 putative Golgi/cell cycle associated protein [Giardia muris]
MQTKGSEAVKPPPVNFPLIPWDELYTILADMQLYPGDAHRILSQRTGKPIGIVLPADSVRTIFRLFYEDFELPTPDSVGRALADRVADIYAGASFDPSPLLPTYTQLALYQKLLSACDYDSLVQADISPVTDMAHCKARFQVTISALTNFLRFKGMVVGDFQTKLDELSETRKQMADLTESARSLQLIVDMLSSSQAAVNGMMGRFTEETKEAVAAYHEALHVQDSLDAEQKKCLAELQYLKDRVERLRYSIDQTHAEIAQLRERLITKEDSDALEAQCEAVEKVLKENQQRYEELNRTIMQSDSKIRSLEMTLGDISTLIDLVAQYDEAAGDLEARQKGVEELRGDNDAKEQETKHLRGRIEALRNEIHNYDANGQVGVSADDTAASRHYARLVAERDELIGKRQSIIQKRDAVYGELSKLEAREAQLISAHEQKVAGIVGPTQTLFDLFSRQVSLLMQELRRPV